MTVLHLALTQGHNEAALFLITDVPGVDVNAPTSDGTTPLMLAVEDCTLQVVRALVAKGADVKAEDEDGETAVVCAMATKHAEAATFMVTAGADWDITVPLGAGLP